MNDDSKLLSCTSSSLPTRHEANGPSAAAPRACWSKPLMSTQQGILLGVALVLAGCAAGASGTSTSSGGSGGRGGSDTSTGIGGNSTASSGTGGSDTTSTSSSSASSSSASSSSSGSASSSASSSTGSASVCGDKLVGPGEECDDGNVISTDRCDACAVTCLAGEKKWPGNNHCYADITAQKTSFDSAVQACTAKGGYIVSLTSKGEQDFVFGSVVDKLIALPRWINLTDLVIEGSFMWGTGEAVSYTNWIAGQPDNFDGVEDCVEMYDQTGEWNDDNCSYEYHYVCEYTIAGQAP